MDTPKNVDVITGIVDIDEVCEAVRLKVSAKVFEKKLGLSPEALLVKAEAAYKDDAPLTGPQAKIFADSLDRWLSLADEYGNTDVWLEYAIMHPALAKGKGVGLVYNAHRRFVKELRTTAAFLKGVAKAGIIPLHDTEWALAAMDFFHEKENSEGYIPGLMFPSWALRNWALTPFAKEETNALRKKWSAKD